MYGVLMNFINSQKDISEWNTLSEIQKSGIYDAIDEIDSGKMIPNNMVMDKFRKKYSNG